MAKRKKEYAVRMEMPTLPQSRDSGALPWIVEDVLISGIKAFNEDMAKTEAIDVCDAMTAGSFSSEVLGLRDFPVPKPIQVARVKGNGRYSKGGFNDHARVQVVCDVTPPRVVIDSSIPKGEVTRGKAAAPTPWRRRKELPDPFTDELIAAVSEGGYK